MKVLAKEVHTNIKNARLVDLRREQIIEGSMQIFAARGSHGATVHEIAEAAGLTRGSMYNYVHSKEDILHMVYDSMTTILTEGLKRAIEETKESPWMFAGRRSDLSRHFRAEKPSSLADPVEPGPLTDATVLDLTRVFTGSHTAKTPADPDKSNAYLASSDLEQSATITREAAAFVGRQARGKQHFNLKRERRI
jgi:AcrR family transcriptional regulator